MRPRKIKRAIFKGEYMPRPSEHEIDESFDREGLIPDEEDEALLNHVLNDDVPRQGLHQHGDWRDSTEE